MREASAGRFRLDDLLQGPRRRAAGVAQAVLAGAGLEGWAGEAGERLATLADEVAQARRANRALLEQLVATEVGRAAGRVGLVPSHALRDALDRVTVLEQNVTELNADLGELRLRTATLEAAVAATEPARTDPERVGRR